MTVYWSLEMFLRTQGILHSHVGSVIEMIHLFCCRGKVHCYEISSFHNMKGAYDNEYYYSMMSNMCLWICMCKTEVFFYHYVEGGFPYSLLLLQLFVKVMHFPLWVTDSTPSCPICHIFLISGLTVLIQFSPGVSTWLIFFHLFLINLCFK